MTTRAIERIDIDLKELNDNPVHRAFVDHQFFRSVQTAPLTIDDLAVFIGQWWHPLHYFPTFLARCVSVLPDIESKSAITRILNQETGGGRPDLAHEVIYADSMARAGFDREVVIGSPPFEETAALVAGYEHASEARLSSLGFIFATEVTDLLMVSSIGTAIERVTGLPDNGWVRIHVEQEPEHVEKSKYTLLQGFTPDEASHVVETAELMWSLWTGFFDRLEEEIGAPA